MEALEKGFVSSDQALEYFEQVDKKEAKLKNAIIKRIANKASLEINMVSYLDESIKQKIKEYVNAKTIKSDFPQELAAMLKSPIFQSILPKNQNITYSDLIFGDYTSVYLDQLGKSVVAVENIAEENLLKKTLEKATELGLETNNLTGLYIMPKNKPFC
jgi:hypothetical protein